MTALEVGVAVDMLWRRKGGTVRRALGTFANFRSVPTASTTIHRCGVSVLPHTHRSVAECRTYACVLEWAQSIQIWRRSSLPPLLPRNAGGSPSYHHLPILHLAPPVPSGGMAGTPPLVGPQTTGAAVEPGLATRSSSLDSPAEYAETRSVRPLSSQHLHELVAFCGAREDVEGGARADIACGVSRSGHSRMEDHRSQGHVRINEGRRQVQMHQGESYPGGLGGRVELIKWSSGVSLLCLIRRGGRSVSYPLGTKG